MNRFILFVKILLVYLALSTNVSLYNVAFGIVVTFGVLALIPRRPQAVQAKDFPKGFKALVLYLILMVKNTLLGGFQVARIVLDPSMPLKAGVVAVDPDSDHELGQALSAHAISLSPGELLVETDAEGIMYIHSLNVAQTEKVTREEQKYRRKLLHLIFGEEG
ncbi:MAG: Na+/H+ antiporter subunit E [Desulfobacterales bacterium]|nr:Na+/H+ antiporter subunit E [Desulfobacterales bacterium]